VKSSFLYIIAEVLVRGIPFLTLPFFTAHLNKSEFGILSLYISLLPLLSIIFDLSQRASIRKFIYDYPMQIDSFVLSILISIFSIFIFIAAIFNFFDIYFLKESKQAFILINIFLYTVIEQHLTKLQISKFVNTYNIFYLFRNGLPYLLAVAILFYSTKASHNVLINAQALIFSILAAFIILIYFNKKTLTKTIKHFKKYQSYAFSIALPILPAVASAYILSVSDRYMIEYFHGYERVAEYSIAYTIAMIVQLLTLTVGKAWQPFIFENLKRKAFKIIIKYSFFYIGFIGLSCITVYIFSKPIFNYIADESYISALSCIPPLLGGMFFFSLYSLLSNIVFFYKKLILFVLPATLAATLNIFLNLIFLPTHGYQIAAWTTFISYFVEFLIILAVLFYIKREGLYALDKKAN